MRKKKTGRMWSVAMTAVRPVFCMLRSVFHKYVDDLPNRATCFGDKGIALESGALVHFAKPP